MQGSMITGKGVGLCYGDECTLLNNSRLRAEVMDSRTPEEGLVAPARGRRVGEAGKRTPKNVCL